MSGAAAEKMRVVDPKYLTAIRKKLESYAKRGIFHSYEERPGSRGCTEFRFVWLAEFPVTLVRIDLMPPLFCDGVSGFPKPIVAGPCEPLTWSTPFFPPDLGYYFVIAPQFNDVVDCVAPGSRYVATLACESVAPPCPWDFDGDGEVGFQDLLKLLSNWGPCPE